MAFPIVAVGASAGGLEALSELLAALPPKGNAAYVVIQHLDPEHKSLLSELLAKKTAMPVLQISEGLAVEPAHVYVIPPNATVTLRGQRFHLTAREGRHHPVDRFFESLSEQQGDAAIGVVLSGGDADGSLGVQAIKHAGGITFAQTPKSARFSGMPQHAIDTEDVDFVLRPREIAAELARLEGHPYLTHLPPPELPEQDLGQQAVPAGEEEVMRRVFRRLRTAHGVDFSHYKRNTLRRRIARRMALRRSEALADYLLVLEDDPTEVAALQQDFLIRVTGFFRDSQAFDLLREQVFPSLIEGRSRKEPLRFWVPGCASGEEVYSIAIALSEYLGERIGSVPIQIFGTDVSDVAIEKARAARYLNTISAEVSEERLQRFFLKEDGHYRIQKNLRDLCVFARQDVTRDPPFSRLDLVSCRNTLIYLDTFAQRRVMRVFHYALKPKGFLLLGPSESVGSATDLFDLIDKHCRLYSRKAGPAQAGGLELAEPGTITPGSDAVQAAAPTIADVDLAQREADRLLLARCAPASLLVDEALNILQVRGETGPYLEFASGAPSLNLHRVARPPLLVELAPAIQEARESGAEVRREGVYLEPQREIALVVIPLRQPSPESCFLILFDDGARAASSRHTQAAPSPVPESEKDRRLAQLERELAATREYLRATLEQHESSKEELKSAHEEVLSANEEFQSTNEELETAKEELQSANEELSITNEELRSRNRELTNLNSAVRVARGIADRARTYADAIINTVIEPLIVLDDALIVQRVNQSFCTAFEMQAAQVEGVELARLETAQWNVAPLLERLREVITNDTAVSRFELTYTVPQRTPRTLIVNAHKIPGDRERASLILLAVEDVTEREASAQRLRLADHRKDEFLAMLAHELRNPLAPITHAMHLLRQRAPGSSMDPTPLYALIERQTHRLVHLVDDLIDVARITRGHIQLQREVVNFTELVREVAEANRADLAQRRHTLTLELPEASIEVNGDPMRLEQIVSNLLQNAIKYTEPGGRITVSLGAEGIEAVLSVRDNGIGIRAEDLTGIFDLFTQIDPTLAHSRGGLGIGLTVVRQLVTLHSGRIDVRSAGIGRGSEFVVRLPVALRKLDAAIPPQNESVSDGVAAPAIDAAAAQRVLIVDDNVDSAESLAMIVRHWGHQVLTARDGPSALRAVTEGFEPDTALLDIGLPGMDGYELARQLRAATGTRPLQLLAMTGYGRQADREATNEAGFDMHFVKPPDIAVIRSALTQRRR